jgi:LysR family transcriptional regulator, chromosome initiation inhibitor
MSLLSANLKAFVAIVRLGTVHGAANELHLTQTAVTQRIRAIERDLGTTLFIRSRKGMKLTGEGEALYRYCKGAEDLEGEALSQITKVGQDHPVYVSITGPTSIMTARIVDQCRPLYFDWPQLYLNFVITDARDRIGDVRSGKASLAIVPAEQVPNEMEGKKLKPDKYILVGSPKWKGRRLSEILEKERVIDFDESDMTTFNYLKKFDLLAQLKRPRLYINSNESIINLFRHGVGFGTLTQEIAKPHIESGALIALNGGAILEDPLALVWYSRPEMPPYFKAIIDSIR